MIGGINYNGLSAYLTQKIKIFHKKYNFYNLNKKDIDKYLEKNNKLSIIEKAQKYHGEWGNLSDIEVLKNNKLVFFGNHLFNHFNAKNLSKQELVNQYKNNEEYLKNINNFCNFFSYPYGQPNLHYNNETNDIIKQLGANHIFTANPINYFFKNNLLLHRLPMHNHVNTETKLREHIIKPKIRSLIKNT